VKSLLNRKAESDTVHLTLADDGSTQINEEVAIELANLHQVLQALQPKIAGELLSRNPDLRAAASRYPGGKLSDTTPNTIGEEPPPAGIKDSDFMVPMTSLFGTTMAAPMGDLSKWDKAETEAQKILLEIAKDPQHALSMVDAIPFAGMRAELLARIAGSLAGKDPAASKTLLGKCMAEIGELKDAGDRVMPLISVAEAAYQSKDKETAWDALGRAVEGVASIHARDTNAGRPNRGLREYWPSVQFSRLVAWRTAKLFGPEAEDLLPSIHEPNLALVSQIEMVRALMGEPTSVSNISFSFQDSPK
jgi:hypothetical protein